MPIENVLSVFIKISFNFISNHPKLEDQKKPAGNLSELIRIETNDRFFLFCRHSSSPGIIFQ